AAGRRGGSGGRGLARAALRATVRGAARPPGRSEAPQPPRNGDRPGRAGSLSGGARSGGQCRSGGGASGHPPQHARPQARAARSSPPPVQETRLNPLAALAFYTFLIAIAAVGSAALPVLFPSLQRQTLLLLSFAAGVML